MAYEDNLASGSWTSLPPPQFNTGLLATDQLTPYQKAMAEMQQSSTQLNSLLSSSGGYRPGIYKPRNSQDLLSSLSQITNIGASGGRSAAEQAQINAFFDAMTPAELAQFQAQNAKVINAVLSPSLLTFGKSLMSGFNPSIFGQTVTPVVTVGELSPASDGGGGISSGGVSATSGSPMAGIASTGTAGQAAAAVAAANAAANAGVGTGGVSTSSGSPMGGISSGGGSAASGGSGGGGGGCCFIMLEARYGDGTMDSVVRRYRDEKITDRNKRGYYKLAEVFVPLMRESKIFKFMVAKTFADPLVSYGKYHYGENRHGWIFKPVERFWMKVFNVLGNDTKFIRENGETV
jgi:hypothetical protein